jgi:hypothetical protein
MVANFLQKKCRFSGPRMFPGDNLILNGRIYFTVLVGLNYVYNCLMKKVKVAVLCENAVKFAPQDFTTLAAGKRLSVISKIEDANGCVNIDAILSESDGILVARGDLGIEIPMEKVLEIYYTFYSTFY